MSYDTLLSIVIVFLALVFGMQIYELYRWRYLIEKKFDAVIAIGHAAKIESKAANTIAGSVAKDVTQTLQKIETRVDQGITDTANIAANLALSNPPSDTKIPSPFYKPQQP